MPRRLGEAFGHERPKRRATVDATRFDAARRDAATFADYLPPVLPSFALVLSRAALKRARSLGA